MSSRLSLRQYSGQVVVVAWSHASNLAVVHIFLILQEDRVVHRTQRLVVKHFGTLHHQLLGTHFQVFVASPQFLHGHHRLATLFHREEIDHCRCPERIVVQCFHCDFRKERQCALTAHHHVSHDVKGVVIGHKRTQVQSRYVLDAVLLLNSFYQFLIGPHTVSQVFNFLDEIGVCLSESLLALFAASVDNRTIGQHQPCTDHHSVTVGMNATVHARRIVHHNATNHRTADAGRIRREHAAKWFQYFIHPCADYTRLQSDGVLPQSYFILFPMFACHDEHRVANALSRQRRACSTEGKRQLIFVAGCDNAGHLVLIVAAYHNFRNLSVETRISTPAEGAQFVSIDTFFRHKALNLRNKVGIVAC